MNNKNTIEYTYTFRFKSGQEKKFQVKLDEATLALIPSGVSQKPEWARLDFFPCNNCPLQGTLKYCPVAANLSHLVEEFKDTISYEETLVTVESPERTYIKKTSVQKGLSSIIGIYMSTSNCPVLDKLRPTVRFHLPFATTTETVYRMVSMYLLAQYFRSHNGNKPDTELNGLIEIYKAVSEVNKGISRRISHASEKDANVNAVVILHSLGDSIPFFIETGLDEIKNFFLPYLSENKAEQNDRTD